MSAPGAAPPRVEGEHALPSPPASPEPVVLNAPDAIGRPAGPASLPSPSRDAAILAAALAIAASAVVLLVRHLAGRQLELTTTTIGYSLFADFNIQNYFDIYHLVVLGLPLFALTSFLVIDRVLGRVLGRRAQGSGAAVATPLGPDTHRSTEPVRAGTAIGQGGRVAFAGSVLGLQLAVWQDAHGWRLLSDALGATAGYAVLAGLLSIVLAGGFRWQRALAELRRVNALGALLPVAGLSLVSHSTTLTIASDGAVRHVDWFPWFLALPLTALLGAWWSLRLRAAANAGAADAIEWQSLAWVAIPTLLLMVFAGLPGELGSWSVFEDGQQLATVASIREGLMPYRDFLFTHGLLEDTIRPLIGMTLFDNSFWGVVAGAGLLLWPVTVLGWYVLGALLVGRSWAALAAGVLLLLHPMLTPPPLFRFVFWPYVLVLLRLALTREAPLWAIATGAATALQAFLVPESSYCIPAIGLAILGRDVYHCDRRPGQRLRGFRRTWWCLVGGATVGALVLAGLAATRSLSGFAAYYTLLVPDHAIEGGIRHLPWSRPTLYWAATPVLAVLTSMLVLGVSLRRRRPGPDDWLLVAAAVTAAFYYEKFLGRADLHVLESYAVAVPVLLILGARLLRALDRSWAALPGVGLTTGRWAQRPASIAALGVALLALDGANLPAKVDQLPGHFRAVASGPPSVAGLGYLYLSPADREQLDDIRTFLDAYLHAGDTVFDFTDQPGIYYYLLNSRPATPFRTLDAAMTRAGQLDLVAELRRSQPRLVVFDTGSGSGLPSMDGIANEVRHYEVSQYLLDAYRPLASVAGQVLYIKRSAGGPRPEQVTGLSHPPVTQGLYFLPGHSCDWGAIPNFFGGRPPSTSATAVIDLVPAAAGGTPLSPPAGGPWSRAHWLGITLAPHHGDVTIRITNGASPAGDISFHLLARGPDVQWLPIGACAQWHGYGSDGVVLEQSVPGQVQSLHLV